MTIQVKVLGATPITKEFVFGGDSSGFGIAPPPSSNPKESLPTFLWQVDLQVRGEKGDPCAQYEFGGVQNIVKFRARATWKSGTTWEWYLEHKLPVRDALDAGSPWYNKDQVFSAKSCNDRFRVEHGDAPTLKGEGKNLIPWDDSFTRDKNSIDSLRWEVAYAAFIVQMYPDKKIKKIDSIGWKLEVWVDFDNSKPFDKRGNFIRNDIKLFSPPGSPIISGPIGDAPKIARFRHQAEADRRFGPF